MAFEGDGVDGGFGGEVFGEVGGAGAGAGGGPFGAALEGFVEAEAEHGVVGVAEGGVEDAAFAVVDDHQAGFFDCGQVGSGGGEDGDVFGGAAEAAVEFVLGVEPAVGEAFGDGVVLGLDFDDEFVLGAVGAAFAGGGVAEEFAVFDVKPGAGFFIAPAPAADADDAVVFGPVAEGVVSSVDGDEAAAVFDVGFEGGADGVRPGLAVVVGDDDVVGGEVGVPGGPGVFGGAFGRGGGDGDGEGAGGFEGVAEDGGGDVPLVVVLAVEDEGLQFGLRVVGEGEGEEAGEEGEEEAHGDFGFRIADCRLGGRGCAGDGW